MFIRVSPQTKYSESPLYIKVLPLTSGSAESPPFSGSPKSHPLHQDPRFELPTSGSLESPLTSGSLGFLPLILRAPSHQGSQSPSHYIRFPRVPLLTLGSPEPPTLHQGPYCNPTYIGVPRVTPLHQGQQSHSLLYDCP